MFYIPPKDGMRINTSRPTKGQARDASLAGFALHAEKFCENFVVVPAGKASNNSAFIRLRRLIKFLDKRAWLLVTQHGRVLHFQKNIPLMNPMSVLSTFGIGTKEDKSHLLF